MQIFYMNTGLLAEEKTREGALASLSQQRIDKVNKSQHTKDQLRIIAAGLLFGYGLKGYGLDAKNATLFYGEKGKPQIEGHPEIQFNLTHSGDYAAAVFSHCNVGIDIEQIKSGREKLVKRFFAEEEQQILLQNWSDETFAKFWTRKESYIKAVGTGMSMPLDSFSVAGESVLPEAYYLKSFDEIPGYYLSVCSQQKQPVERLEKVTAAMFAF